MRAPTLVRGCLNEKRRENTPQVERDSVCKLLNSPGGNRTPDQRFRKPRHQSE